MKQSVSVVIPTYNSIKTLKACVLSILKQSYKPLEVIVIDNASTDKTSVILRQAFPEITVVTLKNNSGVTGGRNKGILEVSSKSVFVLFFDHDMIADPDMIKHLVSTAQENKAIGIVTPKIYYLSDKKRIWAAGTGMDLLTGQVLFRGGKDHGQYETTEEVQVAPAAMLVRKEVIDSIGVFDNRYFATYEDTDFCFRAKRAGFKTFYSHKAIAYHDLSTDPSDEAARLMKRGYWVGRNRVLFMKDFGENYFLFLLFVPVYSLYYLYIALKYGYLSYWFSFMKGTIGAIF